MMFTLHSIVKQIANRNNYNDAQMQNQIQLLHTRATRLLNSIETMNANFNSMNIGHIPQKRLNAFENKIDEIEHKINQEIEDLDASIHRLEVARADPDSQFYVYDMRTINGVVDQISAQKLQEILQTC